MTETARPAEREQNLRKLAQMMNSRHRFPFPISKELVDCFDVALTSDEVEFLLRVGTEPLTRPELLARSGLREDLAEGLFEQLVKKGLLWSRAAGDKGEVFLLAGIMLGWFEVYLSDGQETPEKKEFAVRLDRLFRSFGKMNSFLMRALVNYKMRSLKPAQSIVAPQITEPSGGRTIPVNRDIDAAPMKVYPARTVLQLVEKHGDASSIALVHCFCRHYHKLIGEACRFQQPPESCIVIGSLAHHAVTYGSAKYISKQEAKTLIQELEKKGAVHQVFHQEEDAEQPEIAICNCCWDCCGVFGSYNRGFLPLRFRSYFEARLADASLCSGCEMCVEYCPVQAIAMVAGKASINARKCIGCGQCELQCAEECIGMIPNERDVFLPLEKRSEPRINSRIS